MASSTYRNRMASGLFLLAIIVLEIVLISDNITSVQAGKKKKIMKKIKEMLPMMMMMMVCIVFYLNFFIKKLF